MKTKSLIVAFLFLSICCNSQVNQTIDTTIIFEKAKHRSVNVTDFLCKKATYPQEAYMQNIQGDVVLSFTIKKEGQIDNIKIISSPDISLSTSSIIALNELNSDWSPTKINNTPIDRDYLIVFIYRCFSENLPTDYSKIAKKYFSKSKYEKALKYYNKAILENQYEYTLFETRSKIKELVGDYEGAQIDMSISRKLNDEILSVVYIYSLSVKRTSKF